MIPPPEMMYPTRSEPAVTGQSYSSSGLSRFLGGSLSFFHFVLKDCPCGVLGVNLLSCRHGLLPVLGLPCHGRSPGLAASPRHGFPRCSAFFCQGLWPLCGFCGHGLAPTAGFPCRRSLPARFSCRRFSLLKRARGSL